MFSQWKRSPFPCVWYCDSPVGEVEEGSQRGYSSVVTDFISCALKKCDLFCLQLSDQKNAIDSSKAPLFSHVEDG